MDERAQRFASRRTEFRLPGLWQGGLLAALAALLFGIQHARDSEPTAVAASGSLGEVGPANLKGALGTIDDPAGRHLDKSDGRRCDERLAWVTIMRAPGHPGGAIRIRSGDYFSPTFTPSEVPHRVAIPYPEPYAVGRGTISVLGATSGVMIALQPVWSLGAGDADQRRMVTWRPDQSCSTGER